MSFRGKIAQRLHRPGLVRPVDRMMPDQAHYFRVRTSERYTIIESGGVEHYFRRADGQYDGWGRLEAGETA